MGMRRYDEPIAVRSGEGEGAGNPVEFLWRRRLWRVLDVETRWVETADWWTRPGDDLLAEAEVWRVVAASSRASEPGVYELACGASGEGGQQWRLRAVVD